MKYAIYCLGDPKTGEIRYVGRSIQPEIRGRNLHAEQKNVNRWIVASRNYGYRKGWDGRSTCPVVCVLFWTDDPNDELRTIIRMRDQGHILLNQHPIPYWADPHNNYWRRELGMPYEQCGPIPLEEESGERNE